MMAKGNSIAGCPPASPGMACQPSIGPGSENIFDIFIKMLDILFEVGQMKIKF
jgi:hypothetical protein